VICRLVVRVHLAQNNTPEYSHHKVCIFLLCGVQFTYTLPDNQHNSAIVLCHTGGGLVAIVSMYTIIARLMQIRKVTGQCTYTENQSANHLKPFGGKIQSWWLCCTHQLAALASLRDTTQLSCCWPQLLVTSVLWAQGHLILVCVHDNSGFIETLQREWGVWVEPQPLAW
jgi:hypothetical protein